MFNTHTVSMYQQRGKSAKIRAGGGAATGFNNLFYQSSELDGANGQPQQRNNNYIQQYDQD